MIITRPLSLDHYFTVLPNRILQRDVWATEDSWGPSSADGDVGGGHKKYIEGQKAETNETMITGISDSWTDDDNVLSK